MSKPKIKGVGPDAKTVANENGGFQSEVAYRLDLLPPQAILAVGKVLMKGIKKYPKDNWRKISVDEHLNHAMIHLTAHFAGDTSEPHLDHAACRILFALEVSITGVLS